MTIETKTASNPKESEMMVIGCMLTNNDSLSYVAENLEEHSFLVTEHQVIFHVLKRFYNIDKPADIHLVCEELKKENKLQQAGGLNYILSLAQYAGTSAYIEEYVELVKEDAYRREIEKHASALYQAAITGKTTTDIEPILEKLINAHQTKLTSKAPVLPIGRLLRGDNEEDSYFEKMLQAAKVFQETGKKKCIGFETGFADLDKIVGGLRPSELIIIAARPAMGKTTIALNIGSLNALLHKKKVLIFSLEMSWQTLTDRITSAETGIYGEKIRDRMLSSKEMDAIKSCFEKIGKSELFLNEKTTASIEQIESESRRVHKDNGLDLIIVDYLQLLSAKISKQENRVAEVSKISRGLKTLARELNVPIIAVSQLNREVEDRSGHRPQLSDLRESGSQEQDADVVMFLLREDYYDPNSSKKNQAEVIVAKNRNGEIGSAHLYFQKEIQKFSNLQKKW